MNSPVGRDPIVVELPGRELHFPGVDMQSMQRHVDLKWRVVVGNEKAWLAMACVRLAGCARNDRRGWSTR